jgi:tripartite-type tricarboxylate transporter receptor subunit TctC
LLGRIALDPGSHRVGQTVVVENKAGAGGAIGSFDALIKREIASNLAVSLD